MKIYARQGMPSFFLSLFYFVLFIGAWGDMGDGVRKTLKERVNEARALDAHLMSRSVDMLTLEEEEWELMLQWEEFDRLNLANQEAWEEAEMESAWETEMQLEETEEMTWG
jgi:hypothetical protein